MKVLYVYTLKYIKYTNTSSGRHTLSRIPGVFFAPGGTSSLPEPIALLYLQQSFCEDPKLQ